MTGKILSLLAFGLLSVFYAGRAEAQAQCNKPEVIITSSNPSEIERLAAKEIRRYLYLRTGQLITIAAENTVKPNCAIVIGRKDNPLIAEYAQTNGEIKSLADSLANQQYFIKTMTQDRKRYMLIVGGDDMGTLYGAYRFIERFGVRFYLHGDTIPDGKVPLVLPDVNETGRPLFELRGIHPFHDFPEGPDWWNENDYKAIISQLPKLRMNFFALHTYPEKGPNAEPTVWIGLPEDIEPDGKVKFSYPSSYQNTLRGNWGYAPKKTSEFNFGSSMLFERDDYGPEMMFGLMPEPKTTEQNNEMFNRTGTMLKEVFNYAHKLSVKICVGTETPLVIPQAVKNRLTEQGKDPNNPETVKEIYRGLFERIKRTYPLDYYWLWTPEGWTWEAVKDEQVAATERDMLLAVESAKAVNAPFKLATCGWVLGPPKDRAQFDRVLPKEMPFSCINRQVGFTPVESNFAKIQNRPKWAIPWFEDDGAIISPQLWVGRMRRDAFDALNYGCTGLMGIHWRTRAMAPNASALAKAAWEQDDWSEAAKDQPATKLRNLPAADFYLDWAKTEFGPEAAREIAEIFTQQDGKGQTIPRSSEWVDGPGAIRVNKADWSKEEKKYAFIDELAKLRGKIRGKGNVERFDYWLNTFRNARTTSEVGCIIGRLNETIKQVEKQSDSKSKKQFAEKEILPLRKNLAKKWGEMETYLLETVSNTGEMGEIANFEQHSMRQLQLMNKYDKTLEEWLEKPLPKDTNIWTDYRGESRIIVPTVRGNLKIGENLELKIIILAKTSADQPALYWRPMGESQDNKLPLKHIGRGVYSAVVPAADINGRDIEYYIKAEFGLGKKLYFPAAAPDRNQTVVVN
jgi:hypothetical protein